MLKVLAEGLSSLQGITGLLLRNLNQVTIMGIYSKKKKSRVSPIW